MAQIHLAPADSEDESAIRHVFSSRVLAYFERHKGLFVEGRDERVLFYRSWADFDWTAQSLFSSQRFDPEFPIGMIIGPRWPNHALG